MNISTFVDTVLCNPNDDMPKLVLADFLEEQNDPRAEWLKAWCGPMTELCKTAFKSSDSAATYYQFWDERMDYLLMERTWFFLPLENGKTFHTVGDKRSSWAILAAAMYKLNLISVTHMKKCRRLATQAYNRANGSYRTALERTPVNAEGPTAEQQLVHVTQTLMYQADAARRFANTAITYSRSSRRRGVGSLISAYNGHGIPYGWRSLGSKLGFARRKLEHYIIDAKLTNHLPKEC